MCIPNRLTPLISLVALAALFVPALPARAAGEAVITVDTTDDELINDGDCSLREAIRAANTNTAVDACPAGGVGTDTIILPAGFYQLSIPGANEDYAMTGDLDILGNLDIRGAGREFTLVDGGYINPSTYIDRVFHVTGAFTVEISRLTIQNGNAATGLLGGGGILNQGTLTLKDVSVQNNRAVNVGGGMDNYTGSVTVINSSFSGNTSTEDGGGIFNAGQLFLSSSTLNGNTATTGGGGGLDNRVSATLENATISGNTASGGGGSFNDGELFVLYSSFVANTATAALGDKGGNIENNAGSIRMKTSIVANSLAGPNCAGTGGIVSEGHNLENTNTCSFNSITDLHDVADVMLGPLADNGGPTQTHVLLQGSPAIDAGNDIDCPPKDQRGAYRPADGDGIGDAICDIGAYEYEGVFPKFVFAPTVAR
jgi:CSLREA domain-containing protein